MVERAAAAPHLLLPRLLMTPRPPLMTRPPLLPLIPTLLLLLLLREKAWWQSRRNQKKRGRGQTCKSRLSTRQPSRTKRNERISQRSLRGRRLVGRGEERGGRRGGQGMKRKRR